MTEPDRKQAIRLFHGGQVTAEMSIEVPWDSIELSDVDPHTELVVITGDDDGLHQVTVLSQLVWDRYYRSHMTAADQSIVVIDDAPRSDREVQIMAHAYQMICDLPGEARTRAVEWIAARVAADIHTREDGA